MGYPLIKYGDTTIDFNPRRFRKWELSTEESQYKNQAVSGEREYLSFFERYKISAEMLNLRGDIIQQLDAWWDYVKDGHSFSMTMDSDVGIYFTFEGLELSTDGDVLSVDRTGAANYVNSEGLILEAGEDEARFPAGKFGKGLLIEKASTNLLVESEDLDEAEWVNSGMTVETETGDVQDPEGGSTAAKLIATNPVSTLYQNTSTTIGTDGACFSIWLKSATKTTNNVTLRIQDDTLFLLASENFTVGAEWVRCWVFYNNPGSNANNWSALIKINSDTDVVYAFGAQLEAGDNVLYPTSYIQSVGSAGTRNAETISLLLPESKMNVNAGLISFWEYHDWRYNDYYAAGSVPFRYWLYLYHAATTNVLFYIGRNADGALEASFTDGKGTSHTCITSALLPQSQWNHIAVAWDSSPSGSTDPIGRIYLNAEYTGDNISGDAFTTLSNSAIGAGNAAMLYIGSNHTPAFHADAIIDDLIIFKSALGGAGSTNDVVTNIFNSGRSIGLRRNYLSSVVLSNPEIKPVLKVGGNKYDLSIEAEEEISL